MNKLSLSPLLLFGIVLTGCFGGGAAETPPPPPTAVVVNIPSPTPPPAPTLPPEVVSLSGDEGGAVNLVDGQNVTLAEPTPLPQGDANQVQMPRFNTGHFSFVPPAGWEVVELKEKQVLLVRRVGDETIFEGEKNRSPYVFMRMIDTPADTRLLDVVEGMSELVSGISITEPAAMPILDGVRGVGQFGEGRNDVAAFRTYLVAIPAGNSKILQIVFWGEKDAWGAAAPQMGVVLETMRFPQG